MTYSDKFARVRRPVRRGVTFLLRSESGQSIPIMALVMGTFLFGFIAVAIDGGNLLHKRRLAQAAADAAAVAAAEEVVGGDGATDEQNAANAVAKLNGFDTTLAKNPAVVTISTPGSGNYSGSTSYLQVIVSQPISTYFAGVIKLGPTITVSGRGVAAANQVAPTCVCLEGTTGMDLNMSNNAKLSDTGCGVTVDSSSSTAAQIIGSANVTASSIGSISTNWYPSGVNNGGTVGSGTKVVQGISTSCGPPLPTIPTYSTSSCGADPLTHYGNGGSSYSVGPNSNASYTTTQSGNLACYTSLTVGANGDAVNLNSGIYVIYGGSLHFESGANNASNTGGSGVFFYLVNGASLTIDNGANVNLTAATSGTYAGTLIYQDAADTNALSIQGGSNVSFNGAIYASGAAVTLGNGSGTAIDANIAAKSLTMNGGGTLNSSATSGFGTLGPSVAKLTE
jgi:Flp pilus assembly protein TadG